jgi:hypothetical protein
MLVRLGFAIAIHLDPDVLLVDEVLAVGDIQFQSRCFRKISEFREAGKAIVLVTHDMGAILQHCERVIVLKSGKVVAEEPAQKAVDRYLALLDSGSKAVSQDVTKTPMVGTADRLELAGYRSGRGSGENIEHDLCSMRPGYNRAEFRYGSGKARIIDFAILDAEGRERTHFRSGEAIVFRIRCRFYQDVENPIFGFFIRTVEGIEIYNTNTLYKEMNLGKIDKNEELNVEYRQMPNLQAGSYFLSTGIAQSTANEIVAIDRRYNLAAISILPVDKTTGIVNLHTEIRIYREDHSV